MNFEYKNPFHWVAFLGLLAGAALTAPVALPAAVVTVLHIATVCGTAAAMSSAKVFGKKPTE